MLLAICDFLSGLSLLSFLPKRCAVFVEFVNCASSKKEKKKSWQVVSKLRIGCSVISGASFGGDKYRLRGGTGTNGSYCSHWSFCCCFKVSFFLSVSSFFVLFRKVTGTACRKERWRFSFLSKIYFWAICNFIIPNALVSVAIFNIFCFEFWNLGVSKN